MIFELSLFIERKIMEGGENVKKATRALSLSIVMIMLLAVVIPVFAAENGITPRFNNTNTTNAVFAIDDNDVGTVSYTCMGYEGITSRIVVETKIQKKFLFWWNDVDGAAWTDEASTYYCKNSHSAQLKSGKYKAIITYTVYGSGGATDVIETEIEKSN